MYTQQNTKSLFGLNIGNANCMLVAIGTTVTAKGWGFRWKHNLGAGATVDLEAW